MIATAITFALGAALGAYITARITRNDRPAGTMENVRDRDLIPAQTVVQLLRDPSDLSRIDWVIVDWLHDGIHRHVDARVEQSESVPSRPETATITRPPPGPN